MKQRRLSNPLHNVLAYYNIARKIVRFGGGVFPSVIKAIRVLYTEGLDGVKLRYQLAMTEQPAIGNSSSKFEENSFCGQRQFVAEYNLMRQDILNSGLWDEKWYLSRYYTEYTNFKKSIGKGEYIQPLDYYLTEGWKQNHEPSDSLPIRVNQADIGCNKIQYFLNEMRFDGYQFYENIWIPESNKILQYFNQNKEKIRSKVVYTCILNNYDDLMQPYFINNDWDYICFTDNSDLVSKEKIGVWEIRPTESSQLASAQNNRWHKMHPHILFPNYDESIYVDGNINIISDYIFKEIEKRQQPFLLPQHFCRNCVYDEIEALQISKRISNKDKKLLISQKDFLKEAEFPKEYGLSENNLIYRKHHEKKVLVLMQEWWDVYEKFSSRDQVSMPYILWNNGIQFKDHTIANCRVNYKDFWVVEHGLVRVKDSALTKMALSPAFQSKNIAAVFSTNEQYIPFLGVAIYSLIENADENYNYDIIVLSNEIGSKLKKLCTLADGADNVSIRLYDTTYLLDSLPNKIFHVEGYVPVETYTKCFIADILIGYERCLYLDSDIVILDDIRHLHNIDLKGHAIGASVNVANVHAAFSKKIIKQRRFDDYLFNELGVMDYSQYFQAGVLLLDMKKLDRMNMRKLMLDALKEIREPIFFDQCIFNRIFYGDVCFFSTTWNHVWYLQQYSYLRCSIPDEVFFDYARGRVEPKIIHYAGKDKPQYQLGWKLAEHFWKYAYASPFLGEIKSDVMKKSNELAQILKHEDSFEWSLEKPRLLIHLHLYYLDQLEFMVNKLKNISECEFELYVTLAERNKKVEKQIKTSFQNVKFLTVPNVGYDAYPFLEVLKQVRLAHFDYILKIHTKNSREKGQDEVYGINVPGFRWRDELVEAVVGSKKTFKNNLNRFSEDKNLGCIAAAKYIFSTKKNNEEATYSLAYWKDMCGVENGNRYVGGSIFLARAYPFERLKGLHLKPKDFESEKMSTKDYQNTAHIFERLFGLVIENEGYEIRG